MVDQAQLEKICEDALAAVGYQLVALELASDSQGRVLRIFVDHLPGTDDAPAVGVLPPPCAITHDDCATASRHLGTVLDVEDPIESAYRLEVSSPGVQRPLRKLEDYQRFVGLQVRVTLDRPIEGRKNFVGRLGAVGKDDVTVEVNGRTHCLPLTEIKKARLEVEL